MSDVTDRLAVKVGNLVFRAGAAHPAAPALDSFDGETRVADFVAAFAPLLLDDPIVRALYTESEMAVMLSDMLATIATPEAATPEGTEP